MLATAVESTALLYYIVYVLENTEWKSRFPLGYGAAYLLGESSGEGSD